MGRISIKLTIERQKILAGGIKYGQTFDKADDMQLKGDVTIKAPRKRVWDFMTDPEQIGQCAPGVEKIEMIEPLKKYRGIVSIGLGSVKARFSGEVDVLELDE